MKYFLILACIALLIAVVSSEHKVKESKGDKHAESADKKKHHLVKSLKKYSHEHEKGKKGVADKTIHKKEEHEKGGKKHHSIDTRKHHVAKYKDVEEVSDAKFKHGEKQKKTGFTKGFREQYHKDEHKKSDSYYSNKHKGGQWMKFGSGKSKYHSLHKDKDSNGKFTNGKHSDKYGKEKSFAQGHKHSDQKGFKSKHDVHSQHAKHEHYKKKSN